MSERKVGCENAKGTLNIHDESATCEVCKPAERQPAEWAVRASEVIWDNLPRMLQGRDATIATLAASSKPKRRHRITRRSTRP